MAKTVHSVFRRTLVSLADYPADLAVLLKPQVRPTSHLHFAEEVALPGRDGAKADALLQGAKRSGVQILSNLSWEAVRRYIKDGQAWNGIFNEEETNQLAEEFRKVIATADLLGRSRIRLRQMHANRYNEDDPTDFSAFSEERLRPMVPEQALAYFQKLVPALRIDARHYGPLMELEAFTMAEATSIAILNKVKDILKGGLEGEKAEPRKIVRSIDEVLHEAGIHPRHGWYSEMVMRTNLLSSYNAGAWAEFSDPDLRDSFEVWKYIGTHDGRERHGPLPRYPDHLRWFGKYFDRSIPFVAVRGTDIANVAGCRCTFSPVYRRRWEALKAAGAVLTRLAA